MAEPLARPVREGLSSRREDRERGGPLLRDTMTCAHSSECGLDTGGQARYGAPLGLRSSAQDHAGFERLRIRYLAPGAVLQFRPQEA